jgi:hypothetical protein
MRALALVVLACTWLVPLAATAAPDCAPPRTRVDTVVGLALCVDPAFQAVAAALTQKIRADISAQRQAGKLVAYASTPTSPREGSSERIDLQVAAFVKARLEKELGGAVWVLDPSRYPLPPVEGREPGREEPMLMWTRILAGDDGLGRDFDMVYFAGPSDVRAYFGCGREDVTGCLTRWIAARAAGDEAFRREVSEDPGRRSAFLRYYALRASSAHSKAAHDEWNIFVRVNRRRPIEEQIGVFFDGRAVSPAEMEMSVWPGYELR